jgi:Flp pilus assembly protein TadG
MNPHDARTTDILEPLAGLKGGPRVAQAPARPLGLIRRLSRERRGSVAIEFGIMAMPFIALIFAILETCLSFATQQLITNAVDRVGRDIRTGRLKAGDLNGNQLHESICNRIALMAPDGCPDLLVDLNNYASFAAVPKRVPFTPGGDINTAGFTINPGGPSTINHMRVYYRWPVLTDFLRSYMSNMPGGKTLLLSSATWRNEPFDP